MGKLTRFVEAQQLRLEDLLEIGDKNGPAAGEIRHQRGIGDRNADLVGQDCHQNGRVLVCWWQRCWLDLRPASGECRDCSQVTEMEAEMVGLYHRVVG